MATSWMYVLHMYYIITLQINKTSETEQLVERNIIKDDFVREKLRAEAFDDKEWHISHLRETDVLVQSGRRDECDTATFEDKAAKYKDMIKRDPGFVEYVSSEPLEVDEREILKAAKNVKCSTPSRRSDYIFSSEEYEEEDISFNLEESCLDEITVIDLDIDPIRNYDLECEKTTEWMSLE